MMMTILMLVLNNDENGGANNNEHGYEKIGGNCEGYGVERRDISTTRISIIMIRAFVKTVNISMKAMVMTSMLMRNLSTVKGMRGREIGNCNVCTPPHTLRDLTSS